MKSILFVLLLFSVNVSAKTLKIAVIDTGFDNSKISQVKLCKGLHADFTESKVFLDLPPNDNHGHGTNIVGIINRMVPKDYDYCIVVIRVYNPKVFIHTTLKSSNSGFQYAKNIGVDIINYSMGGKHYDEKEDLLIKRLLDKGVKIIVSAGNHGMVIDTKNKNYFPAVLDPRLIVVGSLNKSKKRLKSSNYGSAVDVYEIGENVCALDVCLTGTSQATAIHTGKVIITTIDKGDKK